MGPLGASWGYLGANLDILGASWGRLGAILGPSWALLGPLGPSWGHLGPSWGLLGPLGAILGSVGAILGPSSGPFGPSLGHLGAILGPTWAHLGPNLGPLGSSLGPLGVMGGFLEPSADHFGTAPASRQNRQKPSRKLMFVSMYGRLVCLEIKFLKDLPGYLGLCWGCWGLFWVSWFQAGALNPCRARAWANRRVPWARPGREPECSLGGDGGAPSLSILGMPFYGTTWHWKNRASQNEKD